MMETSMSLRSFHIVLIAVALALLAFLASWAAGHGDRALAGSAAAGLAVGLPYLYWFIGRTG